MKYRNVKTIVDGIKFDSKKEAKRWQELILLERSKKISQLQRQVTYVLSSSVVINGRKRPALKYVADFVYVENNELIIEDCKGIITEGYRIKRHLMAAQGLFIKET